MEADKRIQYAIENTEVVRPPEQSLATFGTTNIYYYLVTEPVYSEFVRPEIETVIREGRIIAERPRIVTPYYLSQLEGFSADARRYFDMLIKAHGANAPGLFYTYKNEAKELKIRIAELEKNRTSLLAHVAGDVPLGELFSLEDERELCPVMRSLVAPEIVPVLDRARLL